MSLLRTSVAAVVLSTVLVLAGCHSTSAKTNCENTKPDSPPNIVFRAYNFTDSAGERRSNCGTRYGSGAQHCWTVRHRDHRVTDPHAC